MAASLAMAAPEPKPDPVAMAAPQTTGLLSELPGILSGAEDLLSTANINNLQIIISNAAKLLSDSNLDMLQDILTNAHGLLTKDFVDNTTTLIGDATPVCTPLRGDCDNGLNLDVADRGRVEAAGWIAGKLVKGHVLNDIIRDQSRDLGFLYTQSPQGPQCTERIFVEWVYTLMQGKVKKKTRKKDLPMDKKTKSLKPQNQTTFNLSRRRSL